MKAILLSLGKIVRSQSRGGIWCILCIHVLTVCTGYSLYIQICKAAGPAWPGVLDLPPPWEYFYRTRDLLVLRVRVKPLPDNRSWFSIGLPIHKWCNPFQCPVWTDWPTPAVGTRSWCWRYLYTYNQFVDVFSLWFNVHYFYLVAQAFNIWNWCLIRSK